MPKGDTSNSYDKPSFWQGLAQVMGMQQNPQWLRDIKQGKTHINNDDGTFSTMLSSTSDFPGGTALYPGIRLENGVPTKYTQQQAFEKAKSLQDALIFKDQNSANKWDQWFHANRTGEALPPSWRK